MKTFKQFLEEALNSSYDYDYKGEDDYSRHSYTFTPEKKSTISVKITHEKDDEGKKRGYVTFERDSDSSEKKTGEHPRTAAKVFGTVNKILRQHAKEHGLTDYNFEAKRDEPSRVKLYKRMTKKAGGQETRALTPSKFASFRVPVQEMKKPRWEVPAEPGSTPTPEGKIKLYHQTSEKSLNAIRRQGIQLSKAKGYEGPKAIYASPPDKNNRGFYGRADDTPTAEFHVDKDEYKVPFVHRDEVPAKDITAHKEWHATVRYIDDNPELKAAVLRGEHDDLMKKGKSDKFSKAVRFVKKREQAKNNA